MMGHELRGTELTLGPRASPAGMCRGSGFWNLPVLTNRANLMPHIAAFGTPQRARQ